MVWYFRRVMNTVPNIFTPCQVNLGMVRLLLQNLHQSNHFMFFITIPHRIDGVAVADDEKKVTVWFGDHHDVMCLPDGELKMNLNTEFISDTGILAQGFQVKDLFEVMKDFRKKFEPIKMPNMVVWHFSKL